MNWIKKMLFGDAAPTPQPSQAKSTALVRLPTIGEHEFTQPLPVLSPDEPLYEVEIPSMSDIGLPEIDASAHGSHADAHLKRLLEIFSDSIRIAITSKKPVIAISRYDLSISTYREILVNAPPCPDLDYVTRLMKRVVALHPASVSVNEAVGYMDKAAKLKSAKGKRKWLDRAGDAIASIPDGAITERTGLVEARRRLEGAVSQMESM